MSFRFKQFSVQDDRCAMKVGTDGVLLGAWAPIAVSIQPSAFRILDVGTGCGLVALMMAQRFPKAKIDAIDIDEAAVKQTKENFQYSAFSYQLSAFRSSLQDWQGGPYDLIVSNPPYFRDSLKNPDAGRKTARHTDTLSYEELITHSARLLADDGRLAIILPAEAEEIVRRLATDAGLTLEHITHVFSKETKPARRVLLAFSRQHSAFSEDILILENEKGGRSAAYSKLCEEFYL